MATIGALNVVLGAETAAFRADLGKARADLNSFSANANRSLATFDKGITGVTRNLRSMLRFVGVGFGVGGFLSVMRAIESAGPRLAATGKISSETADGVAKLSTSVSQLTDSFLALVAVPFAKIGEGIHQALDPQANAQGRVSELEQEIRSLNAAGFGRNKVVRLGTNGEEITIATLEQQLAQADAALAKARQDVPFLGLIQRPGYTPPIPEWKKPETPAEMMKRIGLPDISVQDFQAGIANNAIAKARAGGIQDTSIRPADLQGPAIDWEKVKDEAPKIVEAWVPALEQIKDTAANVTASMEDAFVNFVTTGKLNFKSLVGSIISDLARLQFRNSIAGPLFNALSGALSGAFGGAFGGSAAASSSDQTAASLGFRASGGPVSRGGLYVVGENGPELFSPGQSGHIIPNGGGGGQSEVHVMVDLSPALIGAVVNISAAQGAAAVKARVRNKNGRL